MSFMILPASVRARTQSSLTLALLLSLVACNGGSKQPTAPTPNPHIQTTLSLADTVVVPGDTITATVRVTNHGKSPQSFMFGCGYTIGIVVENESGEPLIGDFVCPGIIVDLTLGPGETESRTAQYLALNYRDRQPLSPGEYLVRGGLAGGYSHDYPWAQSGILVAGQGRKSQ